MTEDDLIEIERQYAHSTPIFGIGEAEAHIPALIAEVRRLRGLVAHMAEVDPTCVEGDGTPICIYCLQHDYGTGVQHAPECPWVAAHAPLLATNSA